MIPEDVQDRGTLAGTNNVPAERDAAARQVLGRALDRADALELLAQLGLGVPARRGQS